MREMTVDNINIADFGARLLNFSIGGTDFTISSGSSLNANFPKLFRTDYGQREIKITLVFKPKRFENGITKKLNIMTVQKSRFDAMLCGKVIDIWLPDNFYYKCILQSVSAEDFDGESIEVSYIFKSLNFKGSSQELVTRLYAYGKDGLSIESVNGGKEYIDNHTYSDKIICKVWRDERYTNAENLLADAKEKLAEMAVPERSYVCEVIDLAKLAPEKYSDFTVRVNSVITLIDRRRNKRLAYTVVEMKEYPNKPRNNVITLSTTPQKISKKLKSTSVQIDSIQETINAQPSIWEQAIANATALITGAEGGYVVLNPSENPEEILIMDTPNINTAQNVWRWNKNGFGYSANGYSGPFTTAITMDGRIVADFITAGGMKAEIITSGILQGIKVIAETGSIAGWEMQDGILVSEDGTFKLDSKNNTLNVFDSVGVQLMSINKDGIKFWRDGKEIGNIGVTKGKDSDTYGLTFNLVDGDAMTWSVLDKVDNVYVNKVRYTEQDGLTVSNNVSCSKFNGYRIMRNTWTFADGQVIKYWGWEE